MEEQIGISQEAKVPFAGFGTFGEPVEQARQQPSSDTGSVSPHFEIRSGDRPRVSDTNRPMCKRHLTWMRCNTTDGSKSYYKCPVEGCTENEIRVRQDLIVLNDPQQCPICGCACEVDRPRSTRFLVAMTCPNTDHDRFTIHVESPDIAIRGQVKRKRLLDR